MWLRKRTKYYPKLIKLTNEVVPKLAISADAIAFIERTASQSPVSETGGILIGYHSGSDIHVVKATDAGPYAQRSSCEFLRDRAYCQNILNEEFAATGADYVGEWHTHVVDLPGPSDGDLQTLAGIILDPDYNFPSFAMILAIVRNQRAELMSYIVTAEPMPNKAGRKLVSVMQTPRQLP